MAKNIRRKETASRKKKAVERKEKKKVITGKDEVIDQKIRDLKEKKSVFESGYKWGLKGIKRDIQQENKEERVEVMNGKMNKERYLRRKNLRSKTQEEAEKIWKKNKNLKEKAEEFKEKEKEIEDKIEQLKKKKES